MFESSAISFTLASTDLFYYVPENVFILILLLFNLFPCRIRGTTRTLSKSLSAVGISTCAHHNTWLAPDVMYSIVTETLSNSLLSSHISNFYSLVLHESLPYYITSAYPPITYVTSCNYDF